MQRLFHLIFHRQTMAVPPEGARNIFAAHRLIPRNHVLDRPRQQVTVVRQTGRKRRTVIKNKFLITPALFQGLGKDPVILPELQHFLFHLRKVDLIRYWFKHRTLKNSLC